MLTLFAIKDCNTGEYTRWGGNGWTSYPSMTPDIYLANKYTSKGPATTYINQYNKHISQPNSYDASNIPVFRDLKVVEIAVHYTEL